MIHPALQSTMGMFLDWRSVSSLFATLMLLTSMHHYVPLEVRIFARNLFNRIFARLKPTGTIVIDEYSNMTGSNELYDSAQLYLGTHCLSRSPSVRLFKPRNTTSSTIATSLPEYNTTHDIFQGVPMKWKVKMVETQGSGSVYQSLELVFHPRHRDLVHNFYIPHVMEEAKKLRYKSRDRKLYTNRSSKDDSPYLWTSQSFSHPSNFDTLALDPVLREEIRSDLLRFMSQKDHYARVGRAWKRGYLLYGPPGTGKTSLVAAMANLLEFDVFDLELRDVSTNSHLRRLLLATNPKSVLVIEDIDCTLDLSDRKTKEAGSQKGQDTVSLSGMLNFVDGLYSSCVGERLIVFTTNHPERLDPALLRPGRMDKKIELGYCGKAAFRMLAENYLYVRQEQLDAVKAVAEIESLLEEVKVTPAEVAEVLMGCDGSSADAALQKLVQELHGKKLKQQPKEMSEGSGSEA